MQHLKLEKAEESQLLVHRCRKGEPEAQRQLYLQYVKAMYNTVVRLVPERMDAEDIVQDSFVKVFQHIAQYRGESTLGAWIKRITVNTALNFLRNRNRISFTAEGPVFMDILAEAPEADGEDKDPQLDVERIHHAVKDLPEGCRVVLTLYLLEGYKHREIAQLLHISESTSKSQYLRGKQLLRKALR